MQEKLENNGRIQNWGEPPLARKVWNLICQQCPVQSGMNIKVFTKLPYLFIQPTESGMNATSIYRTSSTGS